ncbi:PIG-L deacetylase family protein [Bradyrhizobium sp.]|uniref:PIG-L deacetylase family protein n=1 Tax=Bradyrhizobium sp. TaxID=376 RepID=UPI003C357209
MTAAEYLDTVRRLPLGTLQDLTAGFPFAVLSPHPDDETLGTGGLISAACAAGQRVDVIVITDGSGSHPRSQAFPRQRLIELRRTEVEAAGSVLGLAPDQLHHLGLPDTQAPMSGPAFDAAVAAIIAACTKSGARSLFATWHGDPHCDHQATAQMAKAVRQRIPDIGLWAYPIWGWHLDPLLQLRDSWPRGLRLDISRHQASKRAAIFAHASQTTDLIDDDPQGFRLTEATLGLFLGPFEYFLKVVDE